MPEKILEIKPSLGSGFYYQEEGSFIKSMPMREDTLIRDIKEKYLKRGIPIRLKGIGIDNQVMGNLKQQLGMRIGRSDF